jgi:hypothetical protein
VADGKTSVTEAPFTSERGQTRETAMSITTEKLDSRVTCLEEDRESYNDAIVDVRIRVARIEKVQKKHTKMLDEHGQKLDQHTAILTEHGAKLDEILDLLRAA